MAESGQNERASFGQIARNQTRYGTNTRASITNETFLKHYVKPGETLQGIALKYSSTMEQIKRANNIWTNDSLFLREYLLIPLTRSPLQESPYQLPNGDPTGNHPVNDCEIVTKQELQNSSKMSRSSSRDTVTSTKSENDCYSHDSPRDYFSKFDHALSQIRSSVQQLDKESNFVQDDDNPLSLLPSRRSSRYTNRHKSHSFDVTFGNDNLAVEPDLMFKSHQRNKHQVRSSLERLEKTSDDLFQL